jgi:hypothetical protein
MFGHVLIGCRGWDHDEWVPEFYPEDLPDDWRFCFYSNEIRSVLVPFGDVYGADPHQWREDCDDAFRFVFECPIDSSTNANGVGDLQQLMRHIQPVVDRTAAIVISVSDDSECSASDLPPLLEVASNVPLCVDLSGMKNKDEWRMALRQLGFGQVWHSPCVPSSLKKGFQVSLVEDAELPALRKILESLNTHAQDGAAVFFTDADKALNMARQARTMAEIMGL